MFIGTIRISVVSSKKKIFLARVLKRRRRGERSRRTNSVSFRFFPFFCVHRFPILRNAFNGSSTTIRTRQTFVALRASSARSITVCVRGGRVVASTYFAAGPTVVASRRSARPTFQRNRSKSRVRRRRRTGNGRTTTTTCFGEESRSTPCRTTSRRRRLVSTPRCTRRFYVCWDNASVL